MDDNLYEAERIADLVAEEGMEVIVIGTVALAAHRYHRCNQDVDLGVNAGLKQMRRQLGVLRSKGDDAEFYEPDGSDPLSGMIDVTGPFRMLQIVSFEDRVAALIRTPLPARRSGQGRMADGGWHQFPNWWRSSSTREDGSRLLTSWNCCVGIRRWICSKSRRPAAGIA